MCMGIFDGFRKSSSQGDKGRTAGPLKKVEGETVEPEFSAPFEWVATYSGEGKEEFRADAIRAMELRKVLERGAAKYVKDSSDGFLRIATFPQTWEDCADRKKITDDGEDFDAYIDFATEFQEISNRLQKIRDESRPKKLVPKSEREAPKERNVTDVAIASFERSFLSAVRPGYGTEDIVKFSQEKFSGVLGALKTDFQTVEPLVKKLEDMKQGLEVAEVVDRQALSNIRAEISSIQGGIRDFVRRIQEVNSIVLENSNFLSTLGNDDEGRASRSTWDYLKAQPGVVRELLVNLNASLEEKSKK